jgi:hypothetical protein
MEQQIAVLPPSADNNDDVTARMRQAEIEHSANVTYRSAYHRRPGGWVGDVTKIEGMENSRAQRFRVSNACMGATMTPGGTQHFARQARWAIISASAAAHCHSNDRVVVRIDEAGESVR